MMPRKHTQHLGSLVVLTLTCACGPSGVTMLGTQSESDTGATGETGAETGESGMPDLAPEPDCPAKLGELVSCECGMVDGCELSSAKGEACTVVCEPPVACEPVICEFDIAHGEPACVELVNPDMLDCALDVLLGSESAQVTLTLDNTYPFTGWTDHHTFIRLDSERLLLTHEEFDFQDGSFGLEWVARVIEVSAQTLQACASEDFPEARFACLFYLWDSAQTCSDPESLQCAP